MQVGDRVMVTAADTGRQLTGVVVGREAMCLLGTDCPDCTRYDVRFDEAGDYGEHRVLAWPHDRIIGGRAIGGIYTRDTLELLTPDLPQAVS